MSSAIPGSPDFLHATRSSYDAIARPYTEQFADHLSGRPLDLALVSAFAELVRAAGTAPVADVRREPDIRVSARAGANCWRTAPTFARGSGAS